MHVEHSGVSGSMQTSLSSPSHVTLAPSDFSFLVLDPHSQMQGGQAKSKIHTEKSEGSALREVSGLSSKQPTRLHKSEASGAQCETNAENCIEGLPLGRAVTGEGRLLKAWVEQGDGQDQRFGWELEDEKLAEHRWAPV